MILPSFFSQGDEFLRPGGNVFRRQAKVPEEVLRLAGNAKDIIDADAAEAGARVAGKHFRNS